MANDDREKAEQPYYGSLHVATDAGFKQLLDAARTAAHAGHDLLAVVPLQGGSRLAVLYRNRSWKRQNAPIPADDRAADLFDEDEFAASMPHPED